MKKMHLGLGAAVGVLMMATAAVAAPTGAGVTITNTATAKYNVGATPYSVNASAAPFKVAQIVNVSVTSMDGGNVPVAQGDTGKATAFRITNLGNGPDSFVLTVNNLIGVGDNFDPVFSSIVVDTTGDGLYNAGDLAYAAGTAIPLTAGQSVTVFVLNNIPSPQASGNTGITQLQAQSEKFNSGILGTVYKDGYAAGVDAVLAVADGSANGQGGYIVSSVIVTLTKSSVINDIWGGNQPVPGSTVTYTITSHVTGSGTATGLKIVDPVPANTTYKSNSLKLNGSALTDAAGDDAGDVGLTTANTVTVDLGDVAAGAADSTVVFKVTIN